eukprot:scaffold111_cov252-Pinguiococcus_pyrenoidosus.AAC.26
MASLDAALRCRLRQVFQAARDGSDTRESASAAGLRGVAAARRIASAPRWTMQGVWADNKASKWTCFYCDMALYALKASRTPGEAGPSSQSSGLATRTGDQEGRILDAYLAATLALELAVFDAVADRRGATPPLLSEALERLENAMSRHESKEVGLLLLPPFAVEH